MLDEVDTAGETSKHDHMQPSYTGLQDHVISFHQSQSDPVNRGLSSYNYLTVVAILHVARFDLHSDAGVFQWCPFVDSRLPLGLAVKSYSTLTQVISQAVDPLQVS